jgi:hypothetical protein
MKNMIVLFAAGIILMTLASCTASANELAQVPGEEGEVAGFWQGLWQGFISPFTFLASLFIDNLGIYEVHNNGGWYNFGFMLGVSTIFGGGGRGSARRRS